MKNFMLNTKRYISEYQQETRNVNVGTLIDKNIIKI